MSMRYPGGLIATSPVNARYPSGVWTQAQAAPYQAQNVWTRDQFWPNTTLLLQGDGAVNGAQNNTFLDSSSNNFTITRNGNTTQGSFTPYEANGYWSNYFDGSSILTFASSANYVPGAGQFCLECWFFPTTTSGDRWMIGNRNGNYVPFGINYPATTYPGTLLFYISSNGSSWDVVNGTTVSGVTANQWNHFALVRNSSNQFIVYINGVGTTIATSAANFTSAQPFYVGGSPSAGDADFIGYISNTRFVKGDSVYSGNFTPSTAPLTAITNTQLLTSQSNRFIDNSTNAVTPTLTGTPSVQAFQPFPGATTWSASVLGGSGYFDGSGDFLTAPDNAAFNLSGDFTIEAWVNVANTSSEYCVFHNHTSNTNGVALTINSGAPRMLAGNGSWYILTNSSITIAANTWNHIAYTRSGSTWTIWVNGVSGGTATSSTTPTYSGGVQIGQLTSGVPLFFPGYIADLRVLKGTALYTSTFTPPTAPLTAITNTSLLLSTTNAGIYDNSMMNNLETVGNAQVSTSVVKYGTGSMAFDGAADWLQIPNSQNFNFGSGNFTVEGWVYCTNTSPRQDIFTTPANGSGFNGLTFSIASGVFDVTSCWATGSWQILFASAGAIVANTWYHFAIVRNGGTLTVYINGTSTYSNTTLGTNSLVFGTDPATISYGRINQGDARYLYGNIDDFRVTKGAARYITNFTPPIARLPAQ